MCYRTQTLQQIRSLHPTNGSLTSSWNQTNILFRNISALAKVEKTIEICKHENNLKREGGYYFSSFRFRIQSYDYPSALNSLSTIPEHRCHLSRTTPHSRSFRTWSMSEVVLASSRYHILHSRPRPDDAPYKIRWNVDLISKTDAVELKRPRFQCYSDHTRELKPNLPGLIPCHHWNYALTAFFQCSLYPLHEYFLELFNASFKKLRGIRLAVFICDSKV